jgi:hypothetical protein
MKVVGRIQTHSDLPNTVTLSDQMSGFACGDVSIIETDDDHNIQFHFPSTVRMTRDRAALLAAHIITLITSPE